MGYAHIDIDVTDHTGWLWLNRPEKRNALSADMWSDLPRAVADLDADPEVRVLVVAARGPAFTVGIDLEMLASLAPEAESEGLRNLQAYEKIKELQGSFTALAEARTPVIAAVHGYCLGAGMDLITACDIRLAAANAVFSIRETRMGLVADVGTLQRLPRIIGPGRVAELAYTGRDIDAATAAEIGLVNRRASLCRSSTRRRQPSPPRSPPTRRSSCRGSRGSSDGEVTCPSTRPSTT